MARARTDEDTLEPILPKSPPVAPEPGRPGAAAAAEPDGGGGSSGRQTWERRLLLGCAVVATLALVFCALRLNSIAEDERLQACQSRAYIDAQVSSTRGNLTDDFRDALAACSGGEPDAESGED